MLALAIITGFSLLFSGVLYVSEMAKAWTVVRHTNQSAQFFVARVFREIINTISVLEGDPDIRNGSGLGPDARERVLMKYQTFAKANPEILFVYPGYSDKSMIIDPAVREVPEGYDPTVRPWYTVAQSDGCYGGVVSIDFAIDEIVAVLLQFSDYETGQSLVPGDEAKESLRQAISLVLEDRPGDALRGLSEDVDRLNGWTPASPVWSRYRYYA